MYNFSQWEYQDIFVDDLFPVRDLNKKVILFDLYLKNNKI